MRFRCLSSLLLPVVLLSISACKVSFKGHSTGHKHRPNYKTGKESISSILSSGKKIEHKHFKNWPNEYLSDINFDIFTNSYGSRIGILSSVQSVPSGFKLQSANTPQKPQIAIIMDKIEQMQWDDDNEVNAIFADLNSIKIKTIVSHQPIKSATYNATNSLKTKTLKGKIIGSNSVLRLELVNFHDLTAWDKDEKIYDAVRSFAKSCDVFQNMGNTNLQTKNLSLGGANIWYEVCKKIKDIAKNGEIDNKAAREYFENHFVPLKISRKIGFASYEQYGSFTGYYELDLQGSREKTSKARFPIYALPPECKSAPCATRSEINNGKLSGRGLELYWAENPLDIFLLQIQGSGIVIFENGDFGRVGFAGTNKRRGRNIFSYMKSQCIPKCNASLADIIDWFEANPDEGNDILAKTDSYVFFRKLDNNGSGAIGAQGVDLTPSRSMAVDNSVIPYGTPLWLQTNIAVQDLNGLYIKMNRLLVAQDTGEAIVGAVRGDIFFGHGTKAKYLAEKQKFQGVYFLLVPQDALSSIRVK